MNPGPVGDELLKRPHDRHVSVRKRGAEQVEWRRWQPGGTVRLLETTCQCRARVYELRAAGGRRHIARLDHDPSNGKQTIAYTPPMPAARADALWEKLITGQAH